MSVDIKEDQIILTDKNETIYHYNKNMVLHRLDGPSIIYFNTIDKEWFVNGLRHREDGPAIIRNRGRRKEWFIKGARHRADGPAIKDHQGQFWYTEGKCHRLEGPALMYNNNYSAWYYKGQKIECKSQEEFNKKIKLLAFL